MIKVQFLTALTLFLFTLVCWAQQVPQNQQILVDAEQNWKLGTVQADTAKNTEALLALTQRFDKLSSSMDKFTGIGIGFGAALTILQGIQVFLQVRKRG